MKTRPVIFRKPFLMLSVLVLALATLWTVTRVLSTAGEADAQTALGQMGLKRGICIVLGDTGAKTAIELARTTELTLYVQLADDKSVAQARKAAMDAGFYGTRIYIEKGAPDRLHLADNIADAVIVAPSVRKNAGLPAKSEILRVLHPGAQAIFGRTKLVKPTPKGTDDWPHPYHGPDNNPQSTDQLARAPYLMQFLATPWYSPQPQVTVAAGGRIFKAMGYIVSKPRERPWMDTLIATNAYNGTLLWQRPLKPGFMIHRNTMFATADALYLADDTSCKVIDAATGKLRGEITHPKGVPGGPVWKWMAIENGVLYALTGGPEPVDEGIYKGGHHRGWSWWRLSQGYILPDHPWGFGKTLFAFDLRKNKFLWHHIEDDPIDARGTCMKNGRIYFYSDQKFLGCLNAKTGTVAWKTSDPELLASIGPHFRAQGPVTGFSTSSYIKCSDKALYFAGPQRKTMLVAASAEDGHVLWTFKDGHMRLVLHDEGLYAISEPRRHCFKFDPLTGETLKEYNFGRGTCTRATGSVDSIFFRGNLFHSTGTIRLDVATDERRRLSPMRPPCQDGVMIAHGLLYWGPWMCDCRISLFGQISLCPAGDFDFAQKATDEQRLEQHATSVKGIKESPADWPTYRADSVRSAVSPVAIPKSVGLLWQYTPGARVTLTAPVTAGGMIFLGGSDGTVRALDARTGKLIWGAFTGGPIHFPPTIAKGRVYVGSGDGWVYCFDAANGGLVWRFRAAPVERKIPVYGSLSSTWPVAGGVLVEDGTAYAAAGIASFDGTHVYALDALTGKLRWQNNTSGVLNDEAGVGVSVQGCLLLRDGKLYMAGGNAISPAIYDAANGTCLNEVKKLETTAGPMLSHYRGRDLYLAGEEVVCSGENMYSPAINQDWPVLESIDVLQAGAGNVFLNQVNAGFERKPKALDVVISRAPAPGGEPLWQKKLFEKASSLVVTKNAGLAIGARELDEETGLASHALVALNIQDGEFLWEKELPVGAIRWGIAVDRTGRIIVTLRDGRVLCYGSK